MPHMTTSSSPFIQLGAVMVAAATSGSSGVFIQAISAVRRCTRPGIAALFGTFRLGRPHYGELAAGTALIGLVTASVGTGLGAIAAAGLLSIVHGQARTGNLLPRVPPWSQ